MEEFYLCSPVPALEKEQLLRQQQSPGWVAKIQGLHLDGKKNKRKRKQKKQSNLPAAVWLVRYTFHPPNPLCLTLSCNSRGEKPPHAVLRRTQSLQSSERRKQSLALTPPPAPAAREAAALASDRGCSAGGLWVFVSRKHNYSAGTSGSHIPQAPILHLMVCISLKETFRNSCPFLCHTQLPSQCWRVGQVHES